MRTEETSLLPEDEARRLPLDEIVMVVDAQMPIKAKRIQYFDDRLFGALHAAQKGELPFPKLGGGGDESGRGAAKKQPVEAQDLSQMGSGKSQAKDAQKTSSLADQPSAAPRVESVMQVFTEKREQLEMDFAAGPIEQLEQRDKEDRNALDLVVDDLGSLEAQLTKV